MLQPNYVKSRGENQYRHGVLIGNFVEDKFGNEQKTHLDNRFVSLKSEAQAEINLGNTLHKFKGPEQTPAYLLITKGQKEFDECLVDDRECQKSHLLFGHGPMQDEFERRDFKTTNELMLNEKTKSTAVIDSHFEPAQTKKILTFHNPVGEKKIEDDLPKMFVGVAKDERKAKHHADATKAFDKTYMKTGLRGGGV